MIVSDSIGNISPIILSVLTIAYLMLFELGNEKIKHALRPLVIVLIIIFLIIASLSVWGIYSKLG
ncbi:hypothetical protein J4233_04445 [Candidatus Pacearchaeota archaeon]|nr:hypothetical protein [Candidatus Pacearchaeota archaeon]